MATGSWEIGIGVENKGGRWVIRDFSSTGGCRAGQQGMARPEEYDSSACFESVEISGEGMGLGGRMTPEKPSMALRWN